MKSVMSSTCWSLSPNPRGEPGPRGLVKRGVSVLAAPVTAFCGTPALKYRHHVSHLCERGRYGRKPAAPELPQRRRAELEGVAVTARNLPPSIIDEVGIMSRLPVQGLDRVI